MASLNKVFLFGNLTRDPDVRYTSGGTAVCNLGLAVNRRYTTSQGEDREEVCFVDIEVWGKQAEACGNYLSKGAPALVEGRLRFDQWDDRETGRKRSKLLVRADRVQFVSAPSRNSRSFEDEEKDEGAGGADESSSDSNQDSRPQMPPFEEVDAPEDDIPF